jgi:hypothetical protein
LRSRQRRGAWLYPIEVTSRDIDLAIELKFLREDQLGNKDIVAAAVGNLLRAGLVCLMGSRKR